MDKGYDPVRDIHRLQEQADLFRLLHEKALSLALSRLPNPALFVDLGCADGTLLEDLPFSRILGIDKNEDLLRLAREKLPEGHFVHADIEDEDFVDLFRPLLPKGPILLRISLSLHHLHNPEKLLRDLKDTLPAGSILLLITPDQEMTSVWPEETFSSILQLWKESPFPLNDQRHGRRLAEQMQSAGLRDPIALPYIFTTAGVTNKERRGKLFRVFHEFRLREWEKAAEEGRPGAEESLLRMKDLLRSLEEEFSRPEFFFMSVMFIGLARV